MHTVSVVIPLYNKADYINRALKSVFVQTFQDFEVIVVDDGSTDRGSDIVTAMQDDRIKLMRQENSGVSAARNRGIELANSELIAFLDADDEWEPWFLETVVKMAELYPEAGLYGTAYRYAMSDGAVVCPSFSGLSDGIMVSFFRTPFVWTSAVAVRKVSILEIGAFPVGVKCGEDLDTWIRMAIKYPVAWSSRSSAVYHNFASDVNNAGTLWVGDAPFAATVMHAKMSMSMERWNDLYELLCSQRLRTFLLGTHFTGNTNLSRKMVWESRMTRSERRRLMLSIFLVISPPKWSCYLWSMLTKRSVDKLQYIRVGNI